MSTMNVFSREPLSVGLIVRESLRIFFAQFVRLFAISAIAFVPLSLLVPVGMFGVPRRASAVPSPTYILVLVAGVVLYVVLAMVGSAANTYGVFQAARGLPIRIDECLRMGFRRFGRVLLVAVTVGILAILGFMACIIPGLLIGAANAVAIPAVVVEGLTVDEAMRRSHRLTKGSRGVIIGATLVVVALQFVGSLVSAAAILVPALYTILSITVSIAGSALLNTTNSVIYFGLRSSKESIGVDDIAAVFE